MTHQNQDDFIAEFNDINIIPLVDVMLVLLTIVLTTATFVVNGQIPVSLAESTQAKAVTTQTPYILTMTVENQLYLNDKPINNVATALANIDKAQAITIRADGKIALEKFISLSDEVKALGFAQVNLEVKRI